MIYRFATALFFFAITAGVYAQPSPKLVDEYWRANDPGSAIIVDHSAWTRFLQTYVSQDTALGLNRLDYGAVSETDRAMLDQYLDMLQEVAVTRLNRAEQMAFWMNLYNAFTVQIILDNYPVDSIREIGGTFFSGGPWADSNFTVTVEERELTLDNIEHGILRPLYDDPRVHYGVNCASVGCPNLGMEAFTGAQIDDQLTASAIAFINSPRGVQRILGNRVWVSSIYTWFRVDFGGDADGVLAHLKKYAQGQNADNLVSVTRVGGDAYDWSLNDAE